MIDRIKLTNGETKLQLVYGALFFQELHEGEEGLLVLENGGKVELKRRLRIR